MGAVGVDSAEWGATQLYVAKMRVGRMLKAEVEEV